MNTLKPKSNEAKRRTRNFWTITLFSLIAGLFLSAWLIAGQPSNTPALAAGGWNWTAPLRLEGYVKDPAAFALNPLEGTMNYLATSPAYGVIVSGESRDWLNQTYLKLSTDGGATSATTTFDEFGTQYAAWRGSRDASGYFNIYFSRILGGDTTVAPPKNLTQVLGGTTNLTWFDPVLGYSLAHKKLFLLYSTRGEDGQGGIANPVFFIESGDRGATWSKPLQLGVRSGYAPAEPAMLVDNTGNLHVFWGIFKEGGADASVIMHRTRLADGSWTAPQVAGRAARPIHPKLALAPSGDIFLSWLGEGMQLARWSHQDGRWTQLSDKFKEPDGAMPTVAVGSKGEIWMFWVRGPYGGGPDELIIAKTSTDNGQSWHQAGVVLHTPDAKIGQVYSLTALGNSADHLYLAFTAEATDPSHITGPTLFFMTISAADTDPPAPLPTTTPGSPSPVPTVMPGSPSPSPAGQPGDQFEPDSTLTQSQSKGSYLSPGQSQTHTLYDPATPDHRDYDLVLFQAVSGQMYTISATATNFQPKVSLYRANDGDFIGTTNTCNGDNTRLCFTFAPQNSGVYYAQFSNAGAGPGSSSLVYTITLAQTLGPVVVSPTPKVGPGPAPDQTPTPISLLPARPTVTPTPLLTATPVPTATPLPTAPATVTNPPNNQGFQVAPPGPPPTAIPGSNHSQGPAKVVATPKPVVAPTASPEPPTPTTGQTTTNAATPGLEAALLQIPLPTAPAGQTSGGIGPLINLATPTLTALPTATLTAEPATVTPIAETSSPQAVFVTPLPTLVPASDTNTVRNLQPAREDNKNPPPTGAVWLLPLGLVALGKGILNLFTLRAIRQP